MFAENFITLLQIKKITAYKVAKDTGISQGLCNEYKNGIKTPTIENLIKIADYLDCSVDYLLGRVDTPNGTYSIKGDNNVQINGNSGNHSTFTINNSEQTKQDSMTEDFMKVFKTLSFTDKVEAMKFVTDMTKK